MVHLSVVVTSDDDGDAYSNGIVVHCLSIPTSRSLFNKSIINCAKKSRLNNLMMVFIGKLKVNYRSQALVFCFSPPSLYVSAFFFVSSFLFGFCKCEFFFWQVPYMYIYINCHVLQR